MKIRIKKLISKKDFPREIAEKLVGCDVDLATMMNPEGEDMTVVLGVVGVPESEMMHDVAFESILEAVEQKHGPKVREKISEWVCENLGAIFLISQIDIPAHCCEIIPD